MATFSSELSGSLIFASGSQVQARINPHSASLSITGALHISGSDLTVDGTSVLDRLSNLESGGVSDSASLGPLNRATASLQTFTQSIQAEVDAIKVATGSLTSSVETLTSQVSSLINVTASYVTTASTYYSESAQISSSGYLTSASAASLGFGSGNVSAGTISGSQQIEDLGFITASTSASYVSASNVDGIVDSASLATTAQTASFISDTFISASAVRSGFGSGGSTPAGTISGSAQIEDLGFITSSVSASFASTASFISDTFISSSAVRSGFGSGGGGGATDISGLATTASNQFTGSQFFTGSLIPDATGGNGIYDLGTVDKPWRDLFVTTASLKFVKDGTVVTELSAEPDAVIVGNIKITTSSLSVINNDGTDSQVIFSSSISDGTASVAQQSEVTYDGNRIVSNENLTGLFSASFNAGTSGSVTDFLNAIFFPNTAPSISTGNQVISEFTVSGSSIVTLSATDPEGQTITFGTSSAYTDDFVRVSGSGEMTLNTLATGSMNTDNRGDGTLAHPIIVKATDSFGTATTKTIYLTVTLNQAPVFRETSVAGNIITSFSSSRNENASSGEVTKIYFSDNESDAITIQSSSDANNHFIFTRTGSYVRLLQNTASLDYETTSSYSLSLTASDEHYQSGDDGNSFTTLPVTITVVDNAPPTFNNQTITGVSESVASGTSAGTATASDAEGDTITFVSFTLAGLKLDGGNVVTGSYGGTSKTDPTEDAFQMASNGNVTLKAGAYLNSDIINSYVYSASVSDPFNSYSNATVTIPIADDAAPTITSPSNLYVIESATSGDGVKTNSDGYTGTNARFTADQAVTWSISSSALFSISSDGYVTLGSDISGSAYDGGTQIDGSVTASNGFGTPSQVTFTLNVTDNVAPTITFTNTSANLNTNGARSGSTITTISFSDTEGDTVDLTSFSFTDPSGQLNSIQAGSTFRVQAKNNLSGSVYGITASIDDEHSFATRTSNHAMTIAAAPIGSASNNGTFNIIESAVSGASIVVNADGRTGTQGDIDVTYSPQYNSAAVQSFTSSNSAIAIDSSGGLTLNTNLSGSSTSSGDTITSTITYQDQFNNVGSSSISVSVALNSLPTASFTDQSSKLNTNLATTGTTLVSASITDVESDTPYSASLSGVSGSAFTIQFNNANSSSFEIQAASDLAAGTYPYTASVEDNFGKTNSYGRTITIAAADIGTLGTNGTFYIIESAGNSNTIRTNSNGFTGTQADLSVSYSPSYGSPSVQSFTSSNAQISVNSSGQLSTGFVLSGSGTASGDTITSDITFRDQYDNVGSGSITVNVTANSAPDISFSNTSGNLNTNLGRSGSTLTTLTFSDTESDTVDYDGVSFTNLDSQLTAFRAGTSWVVQANSNLSASTYPITASVDDEHSFRTNTESSSLTIAAADLGTLGTNGTFYAIESAVSGADVVTNSNGRTGTQGDLSVSYSPSYGSPSVASFTSSNSQIAVTNAGALSLNFNLSGSGTSSGDTITSNITFRDQYDNVGSGSITVNVTENAAPTVLSFTNITGNLTASIAAGTDLVSMSIADTESNTPYSASLSGSDSDKLRFEYLNSDSSSAFIEASTTLAAGTYNYDVKVTDSFGKSTNYTGRSFTVATQPYLVYAYGYDGGSPASEAAAYGTLGDVGGDGVGITSGSVIAMFQSGALGTTFSPSYVGGDNELLASASLTTLSNTSGTSTGLASLGYLDFSGDAQIALFLFPSSSEVGDKPASMYNGAIPYGSGTAKQYSLYAKDIAIEGVVSTAVYYFELESAHLGHTNWGMIFQTGQNNNNSRLFLMPSSGSAP